MKSIIINTGFTLVFALLAAQAAAQAKGYTAAKNKISVNTAQADTQLGKKIHQQSLSRPFQQLDSVAAAPGSNSHKGKKARRSFAKNRA